MGNENKLKILALKYRPKLFKDLIGQEVIAETILNAIRLGKTPNAYLLTGIRGVGKTTTARLIAKALNCTKNKKYITTCTFRLKSIPAALYKCLGGFATNQVNLTKLESFSVKNTFDQTNFYLDLQGHIEQTQVQKALEELGFHTESLNILGVYEASIFRQKK